jgi:lipopolysaccharide/colanic/teichoic acid biosynthesis glycosyltransferase
VNRADAWKRALDVTGAIAGLAVGAPFFAGVALAIKLDSPGPVLFRQPRVGRFGVPFTLYKLRTMVAGAAARGPTITRSGDPRVTRLGRHLRRWKLDELPQLWNVLAGSMSLVGPRPETPDHAAAFTPAQRRVLSVKPGLASFASIAYRHEEELLASVASPADHYLETILPAKLLLDLEYVERRSALVDLQILGRAALAVALR